MSDPTSDDFESSRPLEQGDEDNFIHSTPPSLDQPELTMEKESSIPVFASQPEPITDAETRSVPSAEDMLPPEARGEVNGGPLGCCLGTTVGLFLSLSVAIFGRLYSDQLGTLFQQNYGLMGLLIRILMGVLAVVFAILCGRWGWKLGKRFYREYEAPPIKERSGRSKSQKSQQKI